MPSYNDVGERFLARTSPNAAHRRATQSYTPALGKSDPVVFG
jgi:hypothetical protein